jgi:hypothetical protein
LVEAVLLLAHNPELRVMKGKGAREIILKDYSLGDSVDKLISLYTAHYCKQSIIEPDSTEARNHSNRSQNEQLRSDWFKPD